MIDYIHREQFYTKKIDLVITGDGVSLTNDDIYEESMELHESISMEENLAFGSCNASEFKITIANNVSSLIGKRINVNEIIDGDTLNPFELGTYTVVSDVPTVERDHREITAYDDLYIILNAEVSAWYESLTFPMTLKSFRDAFFNYLGITQDPTVLINDNITIEKTITPTTLYGSDVITRICEINACFGRIGRNGHFQYITLSGTVTDVSGKAIELKHEDYQTELIDKVQIRQNPEDIGGIAGTGTNALIIEDNFLMYGKSANELNNIATTVLNAVSAIRYNPIEIEIIGTPCMETGDAIEFSDGSNTITSYVLERTLRGIQTLYDSIYAEGQPIRSEVTSLNTEISQALGRVNALVRTVEETSSQVIDLEAEVQSLVTQTASQISAKVDKVGGQSSSFGWNLGATSFKLISNYDTVFEAKSTGVTITGNITATSGYIGTRTSGFTINSSSFYNGTNSMSSTSDGVYIGTDGINLAGKFKVDKYGAMTSKSGNIAGFTISSSAIYKDTNSMSSSALGVYIGTDGINVAGKFKVTYLGEITLSGVAEFGYGSSLYTKITKNEISLNYAKITGTTMGINYSSTQYSRLTQTGLEFGTSTSDGYINVSSTHKAYFTSSKTTFFGELELRGQPSGGGSSYSKIMIGASAYAVLSFFGATGAKKQTVSGSTDSTKLSNLITALKSYGLIG